MKDAHVIMIMLILIAVAFTAQVAVLFQNQQEMRQDIIDLRSDVDGHAEDVYTLMRSDSARLYTIMDTMIRVFHYAKPHKSPAWNCPECSDIHDKAKRAGSVSVANIKKNTKGEK
tara:strand:+ start:289 stop:633 length:345 start_codon:yes stop_codon:yes gene_type:complete